MLRPGDGEWIGVIVLCPNDGRDDGPVSFVLLRGRADQHDAHISQIVFGDPVAAGEQK
jgi:hypothetical protein